MSIDLTTAAQLDALALQIFDPHIDPSSMLPGTATYAAAADPNIDAQLAALIAEPMLTIDGRTLETGFRYTLNVTCALKLRARHWFIHGLNEFDSSGPWPANMQLAYMPTPGAVQGGVNSFGMTLGLATCAAIAHTWAMVIRMWLMGNYPLAVNLYTGPPLDPATLAPSYYSQNPPA